MAPPRRSLGRVKPSLSPQRLHHYASKPNEQQMSTAKKAMGSKTAGANSTSKVTSSIPRRSAVPKVTASSREASNRGSMGPPSALGAPTPSRTPFGGGRAASGSRLTSASRGPSASRAASGSRAGVMPSVGPGISGSMRKSSVGSRLSTHVMKQGDPRNLQDKQGFQVEAVNHIREFLESQGHSGMPNNFPTTTRDFKFVFEIALQILMPGHELPSSRLDQVMPELVKKLGYPYTINKSTFVTLLGTQHSYPNALGLLHWMVGRAENILAIENNVDKLMFPNRDHIGMDLDGKSDERLQFDFFAKTFIKFNNQGNQSFSHEEEQFKSSVMDQYEVSDSAGDVIVSELRECEQELEILRARHGDILKKKKEETKRIENIKKDQDKLVKYRGDVVQRIAQIEQETNEASSQLTKIVEEIRATEDQFEEIANEHRAFIKASSTGSHRSASEIRAELDTVEKQMSLTKEKLEVCEQKHLQNQVSRAKLIARLDDLREDCNSKIRFLINREPEIESHLLPSTAKEMDTEKTATVLKMALQKMRNLERQLANQLTAAKSALKTDEKIRVEGEKEMDQILKAIQEVKVEEEKIDALIKKEDADLSSALYALRNQLSKMMDTDSTELGLLKDDISELQKELKERRSTQKEMHDDASKFIERVTTKFSETLLEKKEEVEAFANSYRNAKLEIRTREAKLAVALENLKDDNDKLKENIEKLKGNE